MILVSVCNSKLDFLRKILKSKIYFLIFTYKKLKILTLNSDFKIFIFRIYLIKLTISPQLDSKNDRAYKKFEKIQSTSGFRTKEISFMLQIFS